MAVTLGIDVGSVAMKAVVMDGRRPIAWLEEPNRAHVAPQCASLAERALTAAGPTAPTSLRTGATGYGRNLVADADVRVSEIMANAVGAGWLQSHWGEVAQLFGRPPEPATLDGRFHTIVDVGGQDSKVIVFDSEGMVRDFAMNDRCAAGTGRFLEVMAGALEVDIDRLGALALEAARPAAIASTCTVFAESEVVSLLAEGVPREEIAAGIFRSIADQVAGLAARCGGGPPVLFDGGPSRSAALRRAIADRLGCVPAIAPCGQFVTAIGAALIAQAPPESRTAMAWHA